MTGIKIELKIPLYWCSHGKANDLALLSGVGARAHFVY